VNKITTVASYSLVSLEKYMASAFKRCREIIEPKLEDTQCSCLGCSTTTQILTLHQIFEKSWEYVKDVYAFFFNLESI